eukprot:356913-Chlamydomonas_euryale.AAC.3
MTCSCRTELICRTNGALRAAAAGCAALPSSLQPRCKACYTRVRRQVIDARATLLRPPPPPPPSPTRLARAASAACCGDGLVQKPGRGAAESAEWTAESARWTAESTKWTAEGARWAAESAGWTAERSRWTVERAVLQGCVLTAHWRRPAERRPTHRLRGRRCRHECQHQHNEEIPALKVLRVGWDV